LDKTLEYGGGVGPVVGRDQADTKIYRKERHSALSKAKRIGVFLLKIGTFAGLALTALFLALVLFLPLPEPKVPQATRVYDAKGQLVSSLFVQNRTVVGFSDFSPELRQATVAVEDKRFYSHYGLDFQALGEPS
jgi:membrane peptidoglycan carboxypeptidase